jgi:hypothetical protein
VAAGRAAAAAGGAVAAPGPCRFREGTSKSQHHESRNAQNTHHQLFHIDSPSQFLETASQMTLVTQNDLPHQKAICDGLFLDQQYSHAQIQACRIRQSGLGANNGKRIGRAAIDCDPAATNWGNIRNCLGGFAPFQAEIRAILYTRHRAIPRLRL